MKEKYINMDKDKKKASNKGVKGKETNNKATSSAKVSKTKKNSKDTNKLKDKITTEKILLIVFILLLILVICLSVMVFKKKKENDEKLAANLVIPVLKAGTEENITLNVDSLVNEEEYILKLTNYRKNEVNKEEIPYTITVENNSDSEIEVTKDYSDYNLMIDQESIIIEDQKLRGDAKQDVFYHIKVTKKSDIKEEDKINIKIAS